MIEPINPITVIKDYKGYPASECFKLSPPFVLRCKSCVLFIGEGEKPVYFKRKQVKCTLTRKGITKSLFAIKYRIGKVFKDNKKIAYWISEKGEKISE